MSRTAAAELAEDGGVELDGVRVGKSDRPGRGRLAGGATARGAAAGAEHPEHIEGMAILYSDEDIVVVDKPPGVAARHGRLARAERAAIWLAAAGFRISTSGIHERQGIVHRLDVGTSV